MLNRDDDILLKVNDIFAEHREAQLRKRASIKRKRLFLTAVFTSFFLITAVYFLSPCSLIRTIVFESNYLLSDDYYLKLAAVNSKQKYLLVSNRKIAQRLKKEALVASCTVKHERYNVISVKIREKEALGYYENDNQRQVLLKDGSLLSFKPGYEHLLPLIPQISAYQPETLALLAQGFTGLNPAMIAEISSIKRYPFSYDANAMEVVMRDGYYLYLSFDALPLLNNYHALVSGITYQERKPCIFFDKATRSAYTSACPFWPKEDNKTE